MCDTSISKIVTVPGLSCTLGLPLSESRIGKKLRHGSRRFFTPLKSAYSAQWGCDFGRFLGIFKGSKLKKCIYRLIQKSAYTGKFAKFHAKNHHFCEKSPRSVILCLSLFLYHLFTPNLLSIK